MKIEVIHGDSHLKGAVSYHTDSIFKDIAKLADDNQFTTKFIDKVYHAINKRTETMWSLPQLPDLKAPLRQSLRSTLKFKHDPMVKDNPVSLAYGEATRASIDKLLLRFKMASGDSFADIGSGFGKVVVHVAAATGGECYGVEIDGARLSQSAEFVSGMAHACRYNQRIIEILQRVHLKKADCNIPENGDGFQDRHKRDISHIFSFNYRFSRESNFKIASTLKQTPSFKMFAWCKNEYVTKAHYGLDFLQLVDKLVITISGSHEKHFCYVYRNLNHAIKDEGGQQPTLDEELQLNDVKGTDVSLIADKGMEIEEENKVDNVKGLDRIN